MRRLLLLLTCVFFTVNSNAQAYFSPRPVDMGSYELPSKYIGTWKQEKNMGAGSTFKVISNPNKKGHISITPAMGAITPAILSLVNGHLYMSLYDFGSRDQAAGFYIFLVEIPNGEVKITPLKYDLEVPANMSLKDYLSLPDFDINDAIINRSIWFRHNIVETVREVRQTPDTAGRKINKITK